MDLFLDLDLLPSKQYCKFDGPKSVPNKRDERTDARTDEQMHSKNLRLSAQKPLRGNNTNTDNVTIYNYSQYNVYEV